MAAAETRLDQRLQRDATHPVALALSGGGDSVALLRLAADWARRRGRRLLALTVDHRLHPDSGAWTAFAGEAARRHGADWRALVWEGPHPARGLPAAARAARHRLLAEAAREAGARVILMAHTADDRAEAAWMRGQGLRVGDPAPWSPSPAWPEGRGLMLLRPLLHARRAELRAWLVAEGEAWLEDPANLDPRFARARARVALVGAPPPAAATETPAVDLSQARFGAAGELELPQGFPALGEALLCVSGAGRPPRGAELLRLRARLAAGVPFRATLAGCRLAFDGARLRLAREPGRGGLPDAALPPGATVVWDGRFEVRATTPGWRVGPLAGRAAALGKADRAAVRRVPALARAAAPVLFRDDDPRPFLARPEAHVRLLAPARLRAACGQVAHEADPVLAARGEAGGEDLSFPAAGVSKASV